VISLFDALATDVRHALRRIARSPGVSAIVVVTLALALAANTTIFSLLKPTVLEKLEASLPDALVGIAGRDVKTNANSSLYLPALSILQADQRSFSMMAAFTSSLVRIEHNGSSFDTGVEGVTSDYFTVLGIDARAGRLIASQDDPLSAVAVLSDRLATRMFGDADPVGQTILVDGRQVSIIGVARRDFIGTRMDGGDDLFVPLTFLRAVQANDPKVVPRAQQIIGRLNRGVTLSQARAEMLGRWPSVQSTVAAELPAALRPIVESQRIIVESFARGFSGIRERYGNSLTLVMALAVALLAIGCVNLSGLMLARALARQHEFAVRRAMGVGPARLFQQTVMDGALLSIAAVILAVPLAIWASTVLTSMVSVGRGLPLGPTAPDGQIVALAALVSAVCGVLISFWPARRAMTLDMDDVLRGRGVSQRIRGSSRFVLTTQVALSMILVVGAGLFVTTLSNLYANDLQSRANPIIFTRLARAPAQRSPLQQPYFQNLQERLATMPGANAAAYSVFYPAYLGFFDGMPTDTVTVGGAQSAAITDFVSPGFFDLYAIATLRGRDFGWLDSESAPKVAIMNETLARKLSALDDIVGRRVQITSGRVTDEVVVVGVVADANVASIRERHVAGLYRPLMQDLRRAQNPMAHVRVTGDVAGARRSYVDVVNAEGQHLVRGLFTMDEWIDNAVVEQQLIAGMASVAGGLAMILASVGLFGMLAYSVSSRVREIGIRVSVGATEGEVLRMIMREALAVVLPGIVTGIPLALAFAWVIRSQLYGVSATDPWTTAWAALVFLATATVASWLPARRAAQIQPVEALRDE
jgi:putative ABC transport system permease protein